MRKSFCFDNLLLIGTIFFILFTAFDAFAYRPFSTEDAGVGAVKEVAIETAWEMTKEGSSTIHSLNHAFVIGLGRAELIIEAPYVLNGDEKGLNEAVIAVKLLTLGRDEETGMLTFKTEYAAPGCCYGLSVIGTKAFSSLQAHCQLGWCNDFTCNSVLYGLAFDYGFKEWLNFVAEVAGGYNHHESLVPVNALAGFVLTPLERIAVDFAAGVGLTGETDDLALTLGLTFAF